MKAYKCDRCGSLFEKYEGKGTAMYYEITSNPSLSGCLDLCKACVLDLQKWMGKDKEGNTAK